MNLHNHAVNPARPPATTDDGISFDKTAGLKRFHSHSHQLHTFLHNAGWEGGLSKFTCSVALDQNSNNRNCTRDLDPPTHQKQCKFVRLTPLRSVRHHIVQFQYGLEFLRLSYSYFVQSFQDVIRWDFSSLIMEFRPISNRIPEYHHFEEQL